MRLWYLSHIQPSKAQASLRSLARAFAVRTHEVWKQTKGRTKNHTSSPTGWLRMRLKNEFTEDEKCHNLMRWNNFVLFVSSISSNFSS